MAKLLGNELRLAEYDRVLMVARPVAGTVLADMLPPEYWAHVVKNLRQGSRIEVLPAEGTWFAELFVRSVEEKAAHVFVLRFVDFDAEESAPVVEGEAPYTMKFCGPVAKFRVTRVSDNETMIEGLDKLGAQKWIADHTA